MAEIRCKNCGKTLTPQQAGRQCPNCKSMDRNLSAEDVAVVRDKANAADVLARKHYEVEPGLTRIIRYSGAPEVEVSRWEPIKLVTVNTATSGSGVMPLNFGPIPGSGILFPSVIVEVTPDEFRRIEAKELRLPQGWQDGEDLPKPDDVES
jgi:phage FluMu protein Com